MAEFTYNPIQLVPVGGNAILNDAISCTKGYVLHREESGIVTLRGIVNNPCACFARYKCKFKANIAVPEGETVGPISVAISIGGEVIPVSTAMAPPTAVDQYYNVTGFATIDVPIRCCNNIAIRNTSTIPINMQNVQLIVERTA